MKKILAEIKKLELKLATDPMGTIEHLDGYFVDCAKMGQGINTKEVVQMRNAMVELIEKKGIGEALKLDKMVSSPTSKRLVREALLKVVPGFDKLFQ